MESEIVVGESLIFVWWFALQTAMIITDQGFKYEVQSTRYKVESTNERRKAPYFVLRTSFIVFYSLPATASQSTNFQKSAM